MDSRVLWKGHTTLQILSNMYNLFNNQCLLKLTSSPFHLIFCINSLPGNVFRRTLANKKSHKADSGRREGGGNEVYISSMMILHLCSPNGNFNTPSSSYLISFTGTFFWRSCCTIPFSSEGSKINKASPSSLYLNQQIISSTSVQSAFYISTVWQTGNKEAGSPI